MPHAACRHVAWGCLLLASLFAAKLPKDTRQAIPVYSTALLQLLKDVLAVLGVWRPLGWCKSCRKQQVWSSGTNADLLQ